MKMKWRLSENAQTRPEVIPFFAVFLLLLIPVIILIYFFNLSDWLNEKNVAAAILIKGVSTPIVIALTLASILYMSESCKLHYFYMHQYLSAKNNYRVTAYARRNMTLLAWNSLSPVQDIALKMLNMEGAMTLAPETPQLIKNNDLFDVPRLEDVLRKLAEPLKEKLNEPYSFDVSVWIRGQVVDQSESVRSALTAAGIHTSRIKAINVMDRCPGYSLIESWINAFHADSEGYHLLIIADLQNEQQKDFMESATVFLFGCYSDRAAKPLFVTMPLTESNNLAESVTAFFRTKNLPTANVLWHTNLERREKYPLFEALNRESVARERLDVDSAFGERSPGYAWLMLALAADAALYALGPQLLAASGKNGFGMMSIATRYATEPTPPEMPVPVSALNALTATVLTLFTCFFINIVFSEKELAISLTMTLLAPLMTALLTGSAAWINIKMASEQSA